MHDFNKMLTKIMLVLYIIVLIMHIIAGFVLGDFNVSAIMAWTCALLVTVNLKILEDKYLN